MGEYLGRIGRGGGGQSLKATGGFKGNPGRDFNALVEFKPEEVRENVLTYDLSTKSLVSNCSTSPRKSGTHLWLKPGPWLM